MSEYQRLTDEDLVVTLNATPNGDMTKFLLYAGRLWELENKIKANKLITMDIKYSVAKVSDGYLIQTECFEPIVDGYHENGYLKIFKTKAEAEKRIAELQES